MTKAALAGALLWAMLFVAGQVVGPLAVPVITALLGVVL